MSKLLTIFAIWIGVPLVLLLLPCPSGLDPKAWALLAFYVAAILGLILQPLGEAAVLIIPLAVYSVCFKGTSIALSGYSSSTAWLVLAGCLVGRAFTETGLGIRIACVLIDKFGRTTLGLGYVAAFTDFVISPATPSNTARSGGIVYPIFRSISVTLGSEPGATAKKVGSYLSLLCNGVSLTTAGAFLTASAPNLLLFSLAVSVVGAEISWGEYALAVLPSLFTLLLLLPLLYYVLCKPELKKIDNKAIARDGLQKLGPMSAQEKKLALLFLSALALWSSSHWTKIDAGAVALLFIAGILFFRVISWDSMLQEKSAWSTFIWYGAMIGLSSGLSKLGFFKWLGTVVMPYFSFAGMNPAMVMILLIAGSFPLRYIFAGVGPYVGAMVPVFLTLAKAGGVPPILAAVSLCATVSLGALFTHFGHGVSVVIYGGGYVSQTTWWKTGFIMAIVANAVVLGIGFPWWAMLGLW
ncbi:MAG: anion permease [Desulfovibrio sp.]|jgi:DASS family divalent anion:Na+ symporter|nr:anion permease [Desulfovibrio sp.]